MKGTQVDFRQIVAPLTLVLALSGCVSAIKQREVNTALRDVGFMEPDAQCLAGQAGRQLSIRELRSLQRAASSMEKPIREMPVGDVIDAIRQHVDPTTLQAVGRMATSCVERRREGISE